MPRRRVQRLWRRLPRGARRSLGRAALTFVCSAIVILLMIHVIEPLLSG
jgi:hypothetical protein